jgi:4-alpha-glucanotransferase
VVVLQLSLDKINIDIQDVKAHDGNLKRGLMNWGIVQKKQHHGIAVFLPALRSQNSAGIGEYYDLLHLIDWCETLGMDVIQLLPLNDSGTDPSPYNAESSCALNPLYLTLPYPSNTLKALSASKRIDYAAVRKHKMEELFRYFQEEGDAILQEEDLIDFQQENPWLKDYITFKTEEDPTCPPQFFLFVQYLCYTQLKSVRDYAASKNVFLFGDIPILLSPHSADVKSSPKLFDLTLSAGAPPDPYNQQGQYWGFPLYRWDAMKADSYAWWKERLSYASHFFDIYRIDHVVGFFRIWAIPLGKKPTEGFFIPGDENTWLAHGKEILEMMVSSSTMLPIAEDLGTIPDMVRPCLAEMEICGTKVMRWERYWHGDRSYIPYDRYPLFSLTCISTHDSETLQQWWKNCPEEAGAFAAFKRWVYHPVLTLEQRKTILRDSHHTASLFHINPLQEYLALFPELVADDPNDERINKPGEVLATNWTYRYRPSLEQLTSHAPLATAIRSLLV